MRHTYNERGEGREAEDRDLMSRRGDWVAGLDSWGAKRAAAWPFENRGVGSLSCGLRVERDEKEAGGKDRNGKM